MSPDQLTVLAAPEGALFSQCHRSDQVSFHSFLRHLRHASEAQGINATNRGNSEGHFGDAMANPE